MTAWNPDGELPWLKMSYSSNNTFAYCARKFEFAKIYLEGKQRYDDESIPAEVGKAFHHGYQHLITHQDMESAQWELLRHYPWHLDLFESNNRRSWDVVMSTFNAAADMYRFSEYELMHMTHPETGDEIPCVEVPFELRFLNSAIPGYQGFAWIGFIDLILRSRLSGGIRSVDIKTHQSTLRSREAEYKYNTQQVPYGIVVEHLLGKKVETFDVTYLDCFLSLTEPRVQDFSYTKDRQALQEWLMARVFDFRSIKAMRELDLFPRRESGCVSFQYPCKYMDICASRNSENIAAWFADVPDAKPMPTPLIVAEIDLGENFL